MPVDEHRYHPFAACLMFEACHNSKTVTDNINAVIEHGRAHEERRLRTTLAEKERELAQARRERDELQAKLDQNRCNSGHETLPLKLWNCPACTEEREEKLKDQLTQAREALQEIDLYLGELELHEQAAIRAWRTKHHNILEADDG